MAEQGKKKAAPRSAASSRARGKPGSTSSNTAPAATQQPLVRIHKNKREEARTRELEAIARAQSEMDEAIVPNLKRKPGRPRNTPDKWTPEFIASVIADMEKYTEETRFPTECEFCYTRGIHVQRLRECPELRDAAVMMLAKRQAMVINRGLRLGQGDGPLGAFLLRMSVNAGPFSMVDKHDVGLSGSLGVTIVDDI